jgi:hypothetical protein
MKSGSELLSQISEIVSAKKGKLIPDTGKRFINIYDETGILVERFPLKHDYTLSDAECNAYLSRIKNMKSSA